MANAIVMPKLNRKRPTMPLMNATGRKTRHQRQRGREDGEADFFGRLDGGGERLHLLLVDEAVDVLEHDDRVVDHDADGQREREQRHHD